MLGKKVWTGVQVKAKRKSPQKVREHLGGAKQAF